MSFPGLADKDEEWPTRAEAWDALHIDCYKHMCVIQEKYRRASAGVSDRIGIMSI